MPSQTALIISASRGLGLAIAEEYLRRGWHVMGTVRGKARTGLHELMDRAEGRLEIETIDIVEPEQIAALHRRLVGRRFDLLFVNSGISSNTGQTIGEIPTEDFIRLMVTNALSPMRVVEAFENLIKAGGTIGVMSSGLGSIANNSGSADAYSASKVALNMLMKGFAARHPARPAVIISPGWVRTDMGGAHATLSIEESIPGVVDAIESRTGKTGVRFLDYRGAEVPW